MRSAKREAGGAKRDAGGAKRSREREPRGENRDAARQPWRTIAIAGALVALTLFVYLQVRHFDFVNWDDQQYLTENSNVQAGLSWSNVAWAFTTTHSPYWHPLTWLSHMLDVTLFGMDAGWHHVTNLADALPALHRSCSSSCCAE